LWPAALGALAELDGTGGKLESILSMAPSKQLDRVAKLLRQAGREDVISRAAAKAVAEPLKHLDLILWLWGEPAVPVPGVASRLDILNRLLKALHELDIDIQAAGGADRRELQRRIRSALAARDLAGFREVVGEMDEAMASIMKGRIERTGGLAESVRDDMLGALRESFYSLFAKVKVEPWQDELIVWTTEAALHRYEAELKELVEVKIPANSRAIGEAAAHGDLSENSEWKFAIEERNKLQARQAKMQDDLAKARVFHRDDVPTGSVGIGSRVVVRNLGDDTRLDLTLLGSWDTDLQRRRYSYKTVLAQGLLGRSVGDEVTLKLEGDEVRYAIEAIDVGEF
ncbi:MAG: GreA/GreB family elongation factor, partial [Phycisphaerae bacterium]